MRNKLSWFFVAVLSVSGFCLSLPAAVKASRGQIELPTYPWAAVKHPYFRGTDKVNIYPYPMLDFLSRDKTSRVYRTVVLENEYLRITILPELGGKIHEVLDKTTGQPMFYVNHVIKPGLIGQCGAWTSGGVEWNTGPQGHTVGCMQPVAVEIQEKEKDGSQSVAIGETERIYGTHWTVIVTLRPGRSFIEERIRIYNPTVTIRPYYFWNCTAMPNTPGFRFIYPMTLGMDHSGDKFFNWPVDHGKDLTRGTNYQDASSIFAYHCDQDFFGSYDDGTDRGVVSFANHHQVPGKKAWTWGQGGFGKMHQMDLTDSDGPYNEVQTGPLLTQGEVGRLDPCEAVEWKEWWYPVHGIKGFTFANKDVAANATVENGHLRMRLLGSGDWSPVEVRVLQRSNSVAQVTCKLSPRAGTDLDLDLHGTLESLTVCVSAGLQPLAQFRLPLDLPVRTPPEKKPKAETPSELAQAGWDDFLFARFAEAESQFRKALEKDAKCVAARTGLAFLNLDRDPAAAMIEARAALATNPNHGLARFALAVAELRADQNSAALDDAWEAALDPVTAVPARALVAELLIQRKAWPDVVQALSPAGPWREDSLCRDRLARAYVALGQQKAALELLERSLREDPLDDMARSLLASARQTKAVAGGTVAETPFANTLPWRFEQLASLRQIVEKNPKDGPAALDLGHLLFHLGRHAEGREMWKKAAELGASPVVAYRALGMAALTLDRDHETALKYLSQAHDLDRTDAIVARDLAKVLFSQADQTNTSKPASELQARARDTLKAAYDQGKGRSDYVALLARAHNRLGEFADTARMLDSVRVTVWEGAHEVHDLFVEAHLGLGEAQLKAGHASEALAEFNRALEYPENLATGKLENACAASVHYLRGNAFLALGQKEKALEAWKKAVDEPASKDAHQEEARQSARQAIVNATK